MYFNNTDWKARKSNQSRRATESLRRKAMRDTLFLWFRGRSPVAKLLLGGYCGQNILQPSSKSSVWTQCGPQNTHLRTYKFVPLNQLNSTTIHVSTSSRIHPYTDMRAAGHNWVNWRTALARRSRLVWPVPARLELPELHTELQLFHRVRLQQWGVAARPLHLHRFNSSLLLPTQKPQEKSSPPPLSALTRGSSLTLERDLNLYGSVNWRCAASLQEFVAHWFSCRRGQPGTVTKPPNHSTVSKPSGRR